MAALNMKIMLALAMLLGLFVGHIHSAADKETKRQREPVNWNEMKQTVDYFLKYELPALEKTNILSPKQIKEVKQLCQTYNKDTLVNTYNTVKAVKTYAMKQIVDNFLRFELPLLEKTNILSPKQIKGARQICNKDTLVNKDRLVNAYNTVKAVNTYVNTVMKQVVDNFLRFELPLLEKTNILSPVEIKEVKQICQTNNKDTLIQTYQKYNAVKAVNAYVVSKMPGFRSDPILRSEFVNRCMSLLRGNSGAFVTIAGDSMKEDIYAPDNKPFKYDGVSVLHGLQKRRV